MNLLNQLRRSRLSIEELSAEHRGNLRYVKKSEIASGSFGLVSKVRDTKLDKDFAVKKIKIVGNIQYIYREIILLKNSTHPNLLKLRDIYIPLSSTNGSTLKKVYLVMEQMNRTLDCLIYNEKTRPSQENISYIIYQIACGVNHLHKSGIIHRDLKPENIGASRSYRIKLLDYGISRQVLEEMTFSGIGTPFYLAPEISNRKPYNEKADIWSIGVIMSEMIKRQEPKFHQVTVLKLVENGEYEWKKHFDDSYFQNYDDPNNAQVKHYFNADNARDLLSSTLAVDPANRICASMLLSHIYLCSWKRPEEVDLKPNNIEELTTDQEITEQKLYDLICQTARLFNETKSDNNNVKTT